MSQNLAAAVYAFLDWINQFAQLDYPGTEIPIVVIMLSPLAVVLVWRFLAKKIFGVGEE